MSCKRFYLFGILFAWLQLVSPLPVGFAGDVVTFGLDPTAHSLFGGEKQTEQFLDIFEEAFQQEVAVRPFDSADELYRWLVHFRQVDFALFDDAFLADSSAGEVLPLAETPASDGATVRGRFVARQGLDAILLQDFRAALFAAIDANRLTPDAAGAVDDEPELSAEAPASEPEPAEPQFVAPVKPVVPPTPAPQVASQPARETEAPVSLEADRLSYDQEGGVYEADGHVILRQGDLSLTSEQLLLQTATQDVTATGDVVIRQAEDELSGQRMQYNLATGLGSVQQGRVFLNEKNFHLSGESVERSGAATYHVTEGRFTTCDGEVPDWEFSAESVDVTLGRYAEARNAWFRVKDVPLLYFPYLVYPVKTERESGLLPPRFGYSSDKGVQSSLAWYQVIDRNQDATLYLDHYSKKGLGTGLEYRYIFGQDNAGEARYYRISGISDNPDFYAIEWLHGGTLPGGVRLTAEAEYVDDVRFFDDFGEVADDYNQDKTLATLILQRNWNKLNLAGHLRYLNDLESDNDLTLQTLPELSAVVPRYRVGSTPLYLGFESYATRFSSEDAPDGERFFLRPSAAAVFTPGSWLEMMPEVALTQRYYDAEADDDEVTVPEYALTVSTRLQKVVSFQRWGIDRLRHSIEPEVSYLYTPDVDQDELPWFDRHDRLGQQNRIEYALVNRLTTKTISFGEVPRYRDILRLRLSQSYNVDEARDDAIDDKEPFSDLRVELDLRPTEKSFLEADARIAAHNATVFNRVDLEAGLDDNAGNRLAVGYAYRRELTDAPGLSADYLKTVLDTALLKPVYLHLEERYDFQDEGSLETLVGLEYRSRCWSIILSYRDRPDDEQVMVNFVLAGLGGSDGYWE